MSGFVVDQMAAVVRYPDGVTHPAIAILAFIAARPLEVSFLAVDLGDGQCGAARTRFARECLGDAFRHGVGRFGNLTITVVRDEVVRFSRADVEVDVRTARLARFLADTDRMCPAGSAFEGTLVEQQVDRAIDAMLGQPS